MKYLAALLAIIASLLLGGAVAADANNGKGEGHTPVTFCHKPGTPAQHEITTDDDGFLQGHLGHGDSLGSCPVIDPDPDPDPDPEDPPSDPPVTPPTTPPCVYTGAGKDGAEGNDDCAVIVTPPVVVPDVPQAAPSATLITPPAVVIVPPKAKPPVKAKPKPKAAAKKTAPKKAQPKKATPKPDKPSCKKGYRFSPKYGCTATIQGQG